MVLPNQRTVYVVNGEGYVVQTELASAHVVELWAIAIFSAFYR